MHFAIVCVSLLFFMHAFTYRSIVQWLCVLTSFDTEQDCSFNDFLYLCGDSVTSLSAFPSGFSSLLKFSRWPTCLKPLWCPSVTFHFIATSTHAVLSCFCCLKNEIIQAGKLLKSAVFFFFFFFWPVLCFYATLIEHYEEWNWKLQ